MTKAVMQDTADPVVEMARRLPGLRDRRDKLEKMAWPRTVTSAGRSSGHRRRCGPILRHPGPHPPIPCATLAGAAVHVMTVGALNDICAPNHRVRRQLSADRSRFAFGHARC